MYFSKKYTIQISIQTVQLFSSMLREWQLLYSAMKENNTTPSHKSMRCFFPYTTNIMNTKNIPEKRQPEKKTKKSDKIFYSD